MLTPSGLAVHWAVVPSDPVLVTGAFGDVGREAVWHLLDDGCRVVATDLDTSDNRSFATALTIRPGVEVRWADLTKPAEIDLLISDVQPGAILHLAAVIPPDCYANQELARAVNVEATASMVRAAQAQPSPPRFVLASSVAVYGVRDSEQVNDSATVDTPLPTSDLYGSHMARADAIVRSSLLEWVVLRLDRPLSAGIPPQLMVDMADFAQRRPADNPIHIAGIRDIARALSGAITTDEVKNFSLTGAEECDPVARALGRCPWT